MQLRLYSKQAIGFISLLLSPFLGCILFAANLRAINKGKFGPMFIIASIFWAGLVRNFTKNISPLFGLAIANIIGSAILTFFFWDKYFADYDYEKKNFWPPTLLFRGICIALILAQVFLVKK